MEKSKYFKVLINNMENSYLDGIMQENNPMGMILEYFIKNHNSNIKFNQVCKKIGLGKSLVKSTLDYLLKTNILKNGIPNSFKLNMDNKAVQNAFSAYQAPRQGLIEKFKDYKFIIDSSDFDSFNPKHECVDVKLITKDGEEYYSNFITKSYIEWLFEKNKKTGECADGTYFCMPEMVIVEEINKKNIRNTIDELIENLSIEKYFKKYD